MRVCPIQKNQELTLTIDDVTLEGAGVGRVDGFAVFVPGALPGERALVHINKVTASYGWGKLLEVLVPSPHRRDPDCPQYARCGGCVFGHVSYEQELRIKEQQVKDALLRLGGLTQVPLRPILGMEEPYGYRNKGAFPYGQGPQGPSFGLYAPRSHRLVPMSHCLIELEPVNRALHALAVWAEKNHVPPYEETTGKGLLRHGVARVTTEGELMVVVVTAEDLPREASLKDVLSFADSLYLNINSKPTNVIFGDSFRLLQGKPVLQETLFGLKFEVSPRSFLQVNPLQTAKLYEAALDMLAPQAEETAADVYCGIGTISLLLARKVKQVVGIEIVPEAIENARKNARRNGVSNARFYCGPAEDALPKLVEKGERFDCMIIDPPRKGCDPQVLDAICRSGVKRLSYISCNPATLARDVRLLIGGGFSVLAVQPVDMFPRTGHVETACLLSRQ